MIKDILGILADVAGLVFIWWQLDGLTWYWKLTISIGLVLISFAIFYLTRDHREAKVKNYCWDENGAITLILNKNNFYSIDMLVSIYAKDEGRKVLCAIGYVKKDPDDKKCMFRLYIKQIKVKWNKYVGPQRNIKATQLRLL